MGRKKKEDTFIISFRLGREAYEKLESVAKTEKDELEQALNAHAAARRLVIRALNKDNKKR